jgi:hypothetical protein
MLPTPRSNCRPPKPSRRSSAARSFSLETPQTTRQTSAQDRPGPALDDLQLELPLPAIAPLFMAQRKVASCSAQIRRRRRYPRCFHGTRLGGRSCAPSARRAPETRDAPPSPHPSPRRLHQLAATAPIPMPPPRPLLPPHRLLLPRPKLPPRNLPLPRPLPAPAAAPRTGDIRPRDIGDVFGQPGRKNWAPAEIAQRTAR